MISLLTNQTSVDYQLNRGLLVQKQNDNQILRQNNNILIPVSKITGDSHITKNRNLINLKTKQIKFHIPKFINRIILYIIALIAIIQISSRIPTNSRTYAPKDRPSISRVLPNSNNVNNSNLQKALENTTTDKELELKKGQTK